MTREYALPVLLALVLAAVAVYASSHRSAAPEASARPAACSPASEPTRLPELHEASGLAPSRLTPGLFWTHNDSGRAMVYGVGDDGRLRARIVLTGSTVFDWEAVATGPCPAGDCIYVGDIGDNVEWRDSIVVFRAPEPFPDQAATSPVEEFRAKYPNGAQDAEAMFVAGEDLFIVTKGRSDPVALYRFPTLRAGETVTLQRLAALTADEPAHGGRITDAAVSPDRRWVALRTTERLLFYELQPLLDGRVATPLTYDLRALREPQGEGLAWSADGALFLAGEGDGGGTFARVSCTLPD